MSDETRSDYYTDADMLVAVKLILDNFHPPTMLKPSWHIRPDEMARAVLDAVGPKLHAKALRNEAKRIMRDRKLGGMARLEFTDRLRSRADALEGGWADEDEATS